MSKSIIFMDKVHEEKDSSGLVVEVLGSNDKNAKPRMRIIGPGAKDSKLTVEQRAKYYVPHGLPYWIVDSSSIPSDNSYRNAWIIDESKNKPDGYGLSDEESKKLIDKILELK